MARSLGTLMLILSSATACPGPAVAADLAVRIENLRSADGVVRLALYDSDEQFLQSGGARAGADPEAEAGGVEVVFPQLPSGTYAVATYHDENGNGAFDTGLLGLPSEGFGFSNDARVLLGPPSFADAAIFVPAEGATIVVRMRYWDGSSSASGSPVAKPEKK